MVVLLSFPPYDTWNPACQARKKPQKGPSDTVIFPKRKLRLGEVSTTDRLMKPLREQVTTSWGSRIPSILWGLSSHYGLNRELMLYMMSPLCSDNPLRTISPFLLVLADPVPLIEPVLSKYKWMNDSIHQ